MCRYDWIRIPLLLILVRLPGLVLGQEFLFVLPDFVEPVDPKELQGSWKGTGPGGPCAVTISNESLRYEQPNQDGSPSEFWFKTSIIFPKDAELQQLHATIKDSSPDRSHLGKVIIVLFKIVEGTLTLGVIDSLEEPPEGPVESSWDDVLDEYVLKRSETSKDTSAEVP